LLTQPESSGVSAKMPWNSKIFLFAQTQDAFQNSEI
jgi:hypothetical protein